MYVKSLRSKSSETPKLSGYYMGDLSKPLDP